jgi:cytochrome c
MLAQAFFAASFAGILTVVAATSPVIVAQAPEPAKPAAQAADAKTTDGEGAFNNACRTCHSSKSGDNRLGPSLSGIVGRKAGGSEGFAYSQAMKNAGVTWDEKTLDAFIANPEAVVPGSNMKPYTGISDAAVRTQIIAFLSGK